MDSKVFSSRSPVFAGVDSREVDLAQSAIVPDQWEWGAGSLADGSAEARLMLAVLDDAIASAERLSRSCDAARAGQEGRELREWFRSRNSSYTFSFENICATLDIDPTRIRAEIERLEHANAGRQREPRRRVRDAPSRPVRPMVARAAMTAVAVLALLATLAVRPAEAAHHASAAPAADASGSDVRLAHADLVSRDGRDVGHVRITETPQGVILRVRTSLLPQGTHGFHIHSVGQCDRATGFSSAGGHFNPSGASHGFAAGTDHHAGDLPNLEIPPESKLEATFFVPAVTLDDGPRGLLDADGSSLVIHRNADDYETAPAGDAGARIACGVVEAGAESGADPDDHPAQGQTSSTPLP